MNIQAIPFMRLVRMYATTRGLRFFTWQEQLDAISRYMKDAELLN